MNIILSYTKIFVSTLPVWEGGSDLTNERGVFWTSFLHCVRVVLPVPDLTIHCKVLFSHIGHRFQEGRTAASWSAHNS
jgi:hypothetical protein